MRVRDNEFPVVLQAYDTRDKQDLFVAEQVVNTQTEVDTFTSRYAGKLIRVRLPNGEELRHDHRNTAAPRRKSGAGLAIVLILLVLAALVVVGFASGWIQQNLGWNLNF
jgi:uncharacterized protein HemX